MKILLIKKHHTNKVLGCLLNPVFCILLMPATFVANAAQLDANGVAKTAASGSIWDTTGATGVNSYGLRARSGGSITALGPISIITTAQQGYGAYALANSKIILNEGATISTEGLYAAGLYANGANTIIEAADVTISTKNGAAHGVRAAGTGSLVTLHDINITTTGLESSALFAENKGQIKITGGTLTTSNTYAVGLNANGLDSLIEADNITISTAGGSAHGARAQAGGLINIKNTNITIDGNFSYGIVSSDIGSKVIADNLMITVDNIGSHGAVSLNGGHSVISNSTLKISGNEGRGLWSDGIGSFLEADNVLITTNGDFGHAVQAENGAQIDLKGPATTITTTGDTAFGVRAITGSTLAIADVQIHTTGEKSYGLDAQGEDSLIQGTNINITTTGSDNGVISAVGAVAEFSGRVELYGNTSIITSGAHAIGLLSQVGGGEGQGETLLVMDGSLGNAIVTTSGDNAHAATACSRIAGSPDCIDSFGGDIVGMGSKATMNLTNATLTTSGNSAYGLLSFGNAAKINATNITVTTSGSEAHAAVVRNGGTLNLTNGILTTAGANSAGLYVTGPSGVIGDVNLTNVSMSTSGSSFIADGGTTHINLTDVTANINNGTWLLAASNEFGNPSDVKINTISSQLQGAAITATGNRSNIELFNGTQWNMTGNSNVTELLNNASVINYSAPLGNPMLISSYQTLTTDNYHGMGGVIGLNTFLTGDDAPSDRLIINGGAATGNTRLMISNTGGVGLLTMRDGIMVVSAQNGATTNPDAFTLGQRVAAGPYDYLLYYGGDAVTGGNPNDQNWYLRNTRPIDPNNPDGSKVPNIRPEVPVDMAIPPLALAYGYSILDTLHERVGDTWRTPQLSAGDRQKNASSGWGRFIGERGSHHGGNFFRHGVDYSYRFGSLQTGLDLVVREKADGMLDKAGIYIGYGQIKSNVNGAFGEKAGKVNMDAYTLGAYWTHYAPSNWYTDTILQGTWYKANAKSMYAQEINPNGFGIIASLEGGYSFDLGNNWHLEPQAQLAYQNVSFDNARDRFGFVSFDDGESLRGRLGARLSKTWDRAAGKSKPQLMTAWLRANVWHEFLGKTKTSFGSLDGHNMVPFKSSLSGTLGEIGGGISGQISDNVSLFGTAAYRHSLDGKKHESWGLRLGITIKW